MADVKISDLPAAGALQGDELFPVVRARGGLRQTMRATTDAVAALVASAGVAATPAAVAAVAAQLAGKAPVRRTVRVVAETTYTLALGDENALLIFTAEAGCAVTVPADAVAAFPVGASVVVQQGAAGGVSFQPTAAAPPLRVRPSRVAALGELWARAEMVKVAPSTWAVWGDLVQA